MKTLLISVLLAVSVGEIKRIQYDDVALMIYGNSHCGTVSLEFAAKTMRKMAQQKSLDINEATLLVQHHYQMMLFGIGQSKEKQYIACRASEEVRRNLRKVVR